LSALNSPFDIDIDANGAGRKWLFSRLGGLLWLVLLSLSEASSRGGEEILGEQDGDIGGELAM